MTKGTGMQIQELKISSTHCLVTWRKCTGTLHFLIRVKEIGKGVHELGRVQGGVGGRVWREEREGGNVIKL